MPIRRQTSGIRVDKPGHAFAAGTRADVSGTIQTNADGERYIAATTAVQSGAGSVSPVALATRCLGGSAFGLQDGITGACGLNNIGLLVRTPARFWTSTAEPGDLVHDYRRQRQRREVHGSGRGGHRSKLEVRGVTGISSCEKVGMELQFAASGEGAGRYRRLLRLRGPPVGNLEDSRFLRGSARPE